jgi:hypothetical protein
LQSYAPSNLTYEYVIVICRPSSNLVMVWWFLTEVSLLNFEKNRKFSSHSLSAQQLYTLNSNFQLKFDIQIYLRNKQVKFEFGHGSMIWDKVNSLECWKKFEIFSFHTYFCGNVCVKLKSHVKVHVHVFNQKIQVQIKSNDFWQSYPWT